MVEKQATEEKIFKPLRKFFYWVVVKDFETEGNHVEKGVAVGFLSMHFIFGFLALWLTYFQFNLMLQLMNDKDTAFFLKTGLETFYLIGGVIWGNVGWDYYTSIKKDNATTADIIDYLLKFSVPGICLVPLLLALGKFVFNLLTNNTLLDSLYMAFISSNLWFSGTLLILALIGLRLLIASMKMVKKNYSK